MSETNGQFTFTRDGDRVTIAVTFNLKALTPQPVIFTKPDSKETEFPKYYSERETAAMLGKSPQTIARRRKAGKIEYTDNDGRPCYTRKQIEDHLKIVRLRGAKV